MPFVSGEYDLYVSQMSQDREYGTNVELEAISFLGRRQIEIYSDNSADRILVGPPSDQPPIRLSYHRGNHYNAVLPLDD